MEMKPYGVYVQADNSSRIIAVNSDTFITDLTNWIKIDEGYGDKYHHAQGNYFPEPILDDRGVFRYKLVDGKAVERTTEEMDADVPEPVVDSSIWDEMDTAYQSGYDEGYEEGVNTAYDE